VIFMRSTWRATVFDATRRSGPIEGAFQRRIVTYDWLDLPDDSMISGSTLMLRSCIVVVSLRWAFSTMLRRLISIVLYL
jgi:hypothetical protein